MHNISTKTPAIDRAAKVFHFISQTGGATYSEIYQNVGLPQSTTSALLASLVAHGFLRQRGNKYLLGFVFYELGNKTVADLNIRELAQEPLNYLCEQTGLACHLGILDGSSAIYLAKVESKKAIVVRSWLGKRLSLHSSSLGKVLIAWLPESKLDQLFPKEDLPIATPATIATKTVLKQELERVREQGWAFDNEEDFEDVTCIAAPVLNKEKQVVAAISTSGVAFQLPKEKIPAYVEHVKHAAKMLSEKIYI